MSTDANRQLAKHGYDMFTTGNIKGIIDICADDIEWLSPKSEGIPYSGSFQGKDSVGQFFNELARSVEFEEFKPQCFIADADKVAVSGISRIRMLSNGARCDDAWVHIFTMKNGKITRFEQYNNSAAHIAALSAPHLESVEMAGAV